MNSINFNNTATSNGGSKSNNIGSTNIVRQSRLSKPSSQLSYIGSTLPTFSSRITFGQNTSSSTFQPSLNSSKIAREATNESNRKIEKSEGQISSKMEPLQHYNLQSQQQQQQQQQQQYKQYLSYDQIPNANTSGLPAPTSKQRPQQYKGQLRQQLVSPPVPSTIGNALRRRQASPCGSSIVKPISHLLSNLSPSTIKNNNVQATASQQQANFALRRSQSQRPGQAAVTNKQQQLYNQQNTFASSNIKYSSKNLTSRSKSQLDEHSSIEDDEIEDSSSKCVESLPPLKSATYITNLMNNSKRQESRDLDAKSEPICASNDKPSLAGNSYVNSKPSQLVKPLVTKTRRSINQSRQDGPKIDSMHGSIYNQSSVGKENCIPTNLTGSMLPSLSSKLKSETSSNHKRLSLQPTRYNIVRDTKPTGGFVVNNVHRKFQLNSDHESDERSVEEDKEVEEDGVDSDDEGNDGDGDDDDDATTAETMTHTSDSNVALTSANQELNSMIQMLSSSAILGESGMESTSNSGQDFGKRKVDRTPSLSSAHKMKPGQNPATRIKNEVIKSQSLSFATNNHQQQRQKMISNGNQQILTKINSPSSFSSNQYNDVERRNSQQCSDQHLRLPRPRSRIIFDPTSSQFHVSNFAIEDHNNEEERLDSVEYLSNHSSGEELRSETTSDDLLEILTDSYSQINVSQACDNEQDEASLKLIDTHNQIITLKYLPTNNSDSATKITSKTSNNRHSTHEIDTSNRLIGSLDSLIVPGTKRSTDSINKFDNEDDARSTPYNSLPSSDKHEHSTANQRQKSPVGSAFRSLFGLQSSSSRNSIHVVNSNNSNLVKNSKEKVATIVRHGSLKSDPRSYIDPHERPIERKISLQESKPSNHSTIAASSATSKNLGSDLFQRASKKLSASSSSLTCKFKFISSASNHAISNTSTSTTTTTTTATVAPTASKESNFANHHMSFTPPDGSRYDGCRDINSRYGAGQRPLASSLQVTTNKSGLPPRMPSGENKTTSSLGNSSNNSSILNGINVCDRDNGSNSTNNDFKDYASASNCFDNDNDTTILSDASTLMGDSNNIIYINKCAELERTIESLKNRLLSKEKELTDLQLKQWSSDYLTEQLRTTISKLEKENAQLKAVMAKYDRVNL